MKALNWKKLLPHLTAVAVFVLISLVYFSPVLEGKKLEQQDIRQFKGMSEEIVQHAIKNLTKNKTTVVIAHRLSTILKSDKIYVVDSGKVIDSGKHEELLIQSKVYKDFYERQIKEQ